MHPPRTPSPIHEPSHNPEQPRGARSADRRHDLRGLRGTHREKPQPPTGRVGGGQLRRRARPCRIRQRGDLTPAVARHHHQDRLRRAATDAGSGDFRNDLRGLREPHRSRAESIAGDDCGCQLRRREGAGALPSRHDRRSGDDRCDPPRGLRGARGERSVACRREGAQGGRIPRRTAAVLDRGGADVAAGVADGGDVQRRSARAAAALAPIGAGDAGPVLDRQALLCRRLPCPARRRRQHGCAGRARHHHGIRLQPRGDAARVGAAPRLLRGIGGHHHAGAHGQAARSARQGQDRRRAGGAGAPPAEDRPGRARRRAGRDPRRGVERGRCIRRAPWRRLSGRWRSDQGHDQRR